MTTRVWRPGPRSLEEVRDPNPKARDIYPRHVLRDCETALCLFSAAFFGRQDAYWMTEAGLVADCVDSDGARLAQMQVVYPESWGFIEDDAFQYAGFAVKEGIVYDVVSLDPFSNLFEACADHLPVWCSLARHAVIMGCATGQQIVPPDGWQEVRRVFRSDFHRGVEWVVLQPTGQGVDPGDVTACLVTRGDQPTQLARIIDTLPYGEVIVWDNSKRIDYATAGRYMAAIAARNDVVYFQDDDTLFVEHDKLCAAYNPGGITAVYGHGETPGGYADLPLVCGGGLADRSVVLDAFSTLEHTPEGLAYSDFHVGVLTPFWHIHLPFEINYAIAQHPSRLCNQSWAADAKARVTERARAIRDGRR